MSLGWDGPEVLVSDERGPRSILLGRAREERSVMRCIPEDYLSTWGTRREKGVLDSGGCQLQHPRIIVLALRRLLWHLSAALHVESSVG